MLVRRQAPRGGGELLPAARRLDEGLVVDVDEERHDELAVDAVRDAAVARDERVEVLDLVPGSACEVTWVPIETGRGRRRGRDVDSPRRRKISDAGGRTRA